MLNKMLNLAQYELLNYPHRSVGYHIGRPFRALFGNVKDPFDRIAFPNALLAKAMMDYYKKHVNTEEGKEILEVLKRYYNRWLLGGCRLYNIDDAYAGMALIDLYRITKNEKYKNAIDKIAQYLMSAETDTSGSMIYRPGENKKMVYADYIGSVCPFLAKYGTTFRDFNAVNLAVTQIENFMNKGMDEKTILPYHGYDVETGMKMGIIGWGQAVGRLMMGMSEVLFYMESDKPGYEEVRQYYRRLVDKVEIYQADGGLYHWQLSAKEGPADTAASAMILYSIAQSVEDKVIIGIHKSRMLRGVEAIKACVQDDGSLPGASAMSGEFGKYPMEFGAFPWSLGPAISLLVLNESEE